MRNYPNVNIGLAMKQRMRTKHEGVLEAMKPQMTVIEAAEALLAELHPSMPEAAALRQAIAAEKNLQAFLTEGKIPTGDNCR